MADESPDAYRRPRGKPADIFAWIAYDWANSAYSTLLITVLLIYLTQEVAFPDKVAMVAYPWGISLSMIVAALLSPLLGALADENASKRKWLASMTALGSGGAVLLAAIPPDQPWLVLAAFVLTSLFFELSLGFYNGFLPEIAREDQINRVSAWGYAAGYIGGAIALVIALYVTHVGPSLGLPNRADQLRVGLLIMGLWWGGFSLPTLLILRDRTAPPKRKLSFPNAMAKAGKEVVRTLGNIRQYKILALFLLGFLLYNDGIQTVISQASLFATKEIGFETGELIGLILMIQLLAFPGAMIVGFLSDRVGQKATLMGCLAIWLGLLGVAYFVTEKSHMWMLGVVVALVLGGTQSVSRAIMAAMTPTDRAAEFFGFFNFSGKATSFSGSFIFGLVIGITDSARLAIVSLLVFFLIGGAIVSLVNVKKGRQQALEA